jgi:hypothetical protein
LRAVLSPEAQPEPQRDGYGRSDFRRALRVVLGATNDRRGDLFPVR